MRISASRRWMRRVMLSALTGGGLTAVGLGGPLSGGALGAELPTGSTGAGEDTPPPAAGSTPNASPPAQQSPKGEPATTTSTSPAPSTTSAAPPPPAPTPAGPPAPAGATGPTVVVQSNQQPTNPGRPQRKGSKTGATKHGTQGQEAGKGSGGVEAQGKTPQSNSPATVPPGTPNNVAPPPQVVAGQAGTLASVLGQSAVSAQALDYYRIPLFLLPIYQAAGIQYGVPWQILAAINEVETNYGNDQSVSTAGALGWMQFMPETWLQYGVDALGAGYADPYNPVDAIFAAARYLHAAGASTSLHTAILAYNHSEAYVSSVLLRAKLIAGYPQSVIATLTGLTEGRLPVAGARIVPDPGAPSSSLAPSLSPSSASSPASATAGAVPVEPYAGASSGLTVGANPGSPSPGAPPAPGVVGKGKGSQALRFVDLLGPPDAPVTAVEDGRIVKLGHSRKLGNFLALRDVYGDVFTYAGIGSIAPRYHLPARPAKTKRGRGTASAASPSSARGAATAPVASGAAAAPVVSNISPLLVAAAGDSVKKAAQAHDPSPTRPASAGHQLPVTLHVKTHTQHAANAAAQATPPGTGAGVEAEGGAAPPGMGRARLYAHPDNPVARVAATRVSAQSGQSDGHGGRWLPLRLGSVVSQGTVLGHLSVPLSAQSARLRFAIRPAGDSATVDPRPILANWRQLDTALHPRGAKGSLNLLGATVAQVFLMSQGELERAVLSDPGITIYACGRQDIASGAIDGRVLALLAFLSRSGLKPTVSALRCGHSELTTSGNVSEHYFGDAVDISEINGIPITGHQGVGSITDVTIRALLTLQGRFVPHQIISLMQYPEASNTLALPDHWNHIHVGFHQVGAALSSGSGMAGGSMGTAGAAHSAGTGKTAPSPLVVTGDLSPAQWDQLVARIGALQAPTVSAKPSSAAIRDPQAATGNRDLGTGALPLSGGGEE